MVEDEDCDEMARKYLAEAHKVHRVNDRRRCRSVLPIGRACNEYIPGHFDITRLWRHSAFFQLCCGRLLFPCKRYSNTGLYAYFGDECQFALSAKPKRDLDAFEAQSFGTLVKALRQTSFRHQRRVEDEVKALPGPTRGSYPRVVIPHAEAGKGLTIVMHRRLGKFEDQRVSGIKGYIDLSA